MRTREALYSQCQCLLPFLSDEPVRLDTVQTKVACFWPIVACCQHPLPETIDVSS